MKPYKRTEPPCMSCGWDRFEAPPTGCLDKKNHLVGTYYCNHCGKTVHRESKKRWIRSWCDSAGKMTRLWRVQ